MQLLTRRGAGLSGGSNGVQTPIFSTNSTGKICVDPALYNTRDAYSGINHSNLRAEIWKGNSLSGDLNATLQYALGDQTKKCASGLTINHNYFIRIKKKVFVEVN